MYNRRMRAKARAKRDEAIREYKKTHTYFITAVHFGLSMSMIQRIVKRPSKMV